eukprot:scaffold208196_cov13-Tisochrysis_lutea.AAC.1
MPSPVCNAKKFEKFLQIQHGSFIWVAEQHGPAYPHWGMKVDPNVLRHSPFHLLEFWARIQVNMILPALRQAPSSILADLLFNGP